MFCYSPRRPVGVACRIGVAGAWPLPQAKWGQGGAPLTAVILPKRVVVERETVLGRGLPFDRQAIWVGSSIEPLPVSWS